MPTEQQSLFTLVSPAYTKGATIQEKFEAYHAANPWVYRYLVHLANEYVDAQRSRGREPKIGIALLVERLRWEYNIRTVSDDGFKISNDFRSRYARLMMDREPRLAGLFAIKELRTK